MVGKIDFMFSTQIINYLANIICAYVFMFAFVVVFAMFFFSIFFKYDHLFSFLYQKSIETTNCILILRGKHET